MRARATGSSCGDERSLLSHHTDTHKFSDDMYLGIEHARSATSRWVSKMLSVNLTVRDSQFSVVGIIGEWG